MSRNGVTTHVAGKPLGFVQECTRCGAVLTDNRSTEIVRLDRRDTHGLSYWPVGAHVAVYPHGAVVTDDAPSCVPRSAPSPENAT